MIIPDVNLLVCAADNVNVHSLAAERWIKRVLSGPDTAGFSWRRR